MCTTNTYETHKKKTIVTEKEEEKIGQFGPRGTNIKDDSAKIGLGRGTFGGDLRNRVDFEFRKTKNLNKRLRKK